MRRRLTAAVLTLAALTGCGGGATDPQPSTPTSTTTSTTTRIQAGAIATITDPKATVTVRAEPTPTSKITAKLAGLTPYGVPLALAVDDQAGSWLHVVLPIRPNGSVGWVPAGQFRLSVLKGSAIRVNLSDRTITITTAGHTHTGPVAVGSPRYPTPTTGTHPAYVTDNLDLTRQPGAYGTRALGLSLHSDAITEFGSGDGQVGIHGTDDPGSIGHPVTHGCIRVPAGLEPVLAKVPVGTPVVIG